MGGDATPRGPQVGPVAVGARVVRVLPDAPAIDKEFDYSVPYGLDVRVGSLVRIPLHGRRHGGWVVAEEVTPPPGVVVRPLTKVTGWGPAAELVDLAAWAAWRWAGRRAHFLRTASPDRVVQGLPAVTRVPPAGGAPDSLAEEALGSGRAVARVPPAYDLGPLLLAAARRGTTLVVAPSHADAAGHAARLRQAGLSVALLPNEWARAAAGAQVVIGARAAAWGPALDLAAVVVLDEHAEGHQEEAAPTWSARDVAVERARRSGVPCVLTSPCPSLEALGWGRLVAPSRAAERSGWPVVEVTDRPSATDLYSRRLVDLVRSGARVVCVLNRTGRVRLLLCAACEEPARCEACGAAVSSGEGAGGDRLLTCRSCGTVRPLVCLQCGAGRFKARRLGVSRAREDLERLAGVPVAEVTGASPAGGGDAAVLVGTEAVLHRAGGADAVAFLDFDAELLAPRYRAAEDALALLALAGRLVGGRGGRLLLQTRLADHEVVQAAVRADPSRVATVESERRASLRFPPTVALAQVSGAPAAGYVAAFQGRPGLELLGPVDGAWLIRAPDHSVLCDALASVPRPPGRLRVAVDPRRI